MLYYTPFNDASIASSSDDVDPVGITDILVPILSMVTFPRLTVRWEVMVTLGEHH